MACGTLMSVPIRPRSARVRHVWVEMASGPTDIVLDHARRAISSFPMIHSADDAVDPAMLPGLPPRFALLRTRTAIDHVDDVLVLLLAARRRLAGSAGWLKPSAGMAMRDPLREERVQIRMHALSQRLEAHACDLLGAAMARLSSSAAAISCPCIRSNSFRSLARAWAANGLSCWMVVNR